MAKGLWLKARGLRPEGGRDMMEDFPLCVVQNCVPFVSCCPKKQYGTAVPLPCLGVSIKVFESV